MRLFKGTFVKKDGTSRTMKFVKVIDLPQAILERIRRPTAPFVKKGLETVWDVESANFRIFNHNTVKGELAVEELSEETFLTNASL